MKLKLLLICGMVFVMNSAGAKDLTELKTDKEKLSYGIGVSVAKNLKKQNTDFDLDIIIKGIKDGLSGEKPLLSDKEIRVVMNQYQTEIRQNAAWSKQKTLDENKKKSDKFLDENKSKPGVVALPSGVQYKVLKSGTGRKPLDSELLEVNYRGTLMDGTEFDATLPGHPVKLKASAMIKGWKEALKLMNIGSKWQIFIPPHLAYGERGVGGDIGPNELLIFEVELLDIK